MSKPGYIWWVNQKCYEAMPKLPQDDDIRLYVREQWESRRGRPGRCRLWVSSIFDSSTGVKDWPDTPFTRWLEREDFGGIVLEWDGPIGIFKELPGIITDMNMIRVGDTP